MADTGLERPSLNPAKNVGRVLALGVDPGSVCACLLEDVGGQHRLVGWLGAPWPADTPVADALGAVVRRLGEQLHTALWDAEAQAPFHRSGDPIRFPPVDHVSVAASPLLPLRVWLAGLTAGVGAAAAQHALAACPVDLVGVTRLTADLEADSLAQALAVARPQVVVLAGGYDVANAPAQAGLWRLATQMLAGLERLPAGDRPHLLFAGSRSVGEQLRAQEGCTVVANLLPQPGLVRQEGLVAALHERYWALCRQMPQFGRVLGWATDAVGATTLEVNFARLVRTWQAAHGLPGLHGVYDALDRRVHVWARRDEGPVRVQYLQPQLPSPAGWPPVGLVSSAGRTPGPVHVPGGWHDAIGLAPVIAAVGASAPLAMLQVLSRDVFGQ